ncbi:hypothetical protein V2J09_018740 [Rumex salicifolius]
MALPRKVEHQFEWALIFTLCFMTLAIFPSKSVGRLMNVNQGKEMMRLVLGSSPPRCINKCMNCNPCKPVLVIPSHRKMKIYNFRQQSSVLSPELTTQDEENYYLVSWKCKCKDKLFQP